MLDPETTHCEGCMYGAKRGRLTASVSEDQLLRGGMLHRECDSEHGFHKGTCLPQEVRLDSQDGCSLGAHVCVVSQTEGNRDG